jgi:hypothetical protein
VINNYDGFPPHLNLHIFMKKISLKLFFKDYLNDETKYVLSMWSLAKLKLDEEK